MHRRSLFIAIVCLLLASSWAPGQSARDKDEARVEATLKERKIMVTRDGFGVVRAIEPENRWGKSLQIKAPSAQAAAVEFLARYADLLGIKPESIKTNRIAKPGFVADAGQEYRLSHEMPDASDPSITRYLFDQFQFQLPFYESGIVVEVQREKDGTFHFLKLDSSAHPETKVKAPAPDKVAACLKLSQRQLGHLLFSSASDLDLSSLKIERRDLVICRYEAERRLFIASTTFAPVAMPAVILPPLDPGIEDRGDYVAMQIMFTVRSKVKDWQQSQVIALIAVETQTVLRLTLTNG